MAAAPFMTHNNVCMASETPFHSKQLSCYRVRRELTALIECARVYILIVTFGADFHVLKMLTFIHNHYEECKACFLSVHRILHI